MGIATSGEQALHMMRVQAPGGEFPFQVAFLEWRLPGMDGWEVVRQIRQLSQSFAGPAPVLVMIASHTWSARALRTHEEQSMLNAFVAKPVTASMLADAALESQPINAVLRKSTRSDRLQRLTGMRLLVVEDKLINQQAARQLLWAEGALVTLAANGQLGVDAVARDHPQFDAVLMDIQMPVLDGYAAMGLIRQQLGLKELPVIEMTANAMASDREFCLAAGMDDHIGKPFDLTQLVLLLTRHAPGVSPVTGADLP